MFFSESILSKKGSLARIWLAAHWERKLSKAQFLQTNIQQSVGAIVHNEQPMALRLTGQLLLGVVKIYSRKARYLLEDCNEALMKIKLAFRPGAVDLPEEQATAAYRAITLPDVITEFEILLPEPGFQLHNFRERSSQLSSQTLSRKEDITITESPLRLSQPLVIEEPDILAQPLIDDGAGDEWRFDLADLEALPKRPRLAADEDSMEIEVGRRGPANDDSFADNFGFGEMDSFLDAHAKGSAAEGQSDILDPALMVVEAPNHIEGDRVWDMAEPILLAPAFADDAFRIPPSDVNQEGDDGAYLFPSPNVKAKKAKQGVQPRKRKLHFDSHLEIPSRQIQSQLQDSHGIVLDADPYLPRFATTIRLRERESLGVQHFSTAACFGTVRGDLWALVVAEPRVQQRPNSTKPSADWEAFGYAEGPISPHDHVRASEMEPGPAYDADGPFDLTIDYQPGDVNEMAMPATPAGHAAVHPTTPFVLDAVSVPSADDQAHRKAADPAPTTDALMGMIRAVNGMRVNFGDLTIKAWS
ncbi:Rec8 like protein-domain-containing protein [Hyaloraphidium curvatum]|nr:Rec8 like protein-domain-containing protein [Hyaloraphidium curvatum]